MQQGWIVSSAAVVALSGSLLMGCSDKSNASRGPESNATEKLGHFGHAVRPSTTPSTSTDIPATPSGAPASPTSAEPSREPGTGAPEEAPKETAESAAAAAPECKEISATRPGACDPEHVKPTPSPKSIHCHGITI